MLNELIQLRKSTKDLESSNAETADKRLMELTSQNKRAQLELGKNSQELERLRAEVQRLSDDLDIANEKVKTLPEMEVRIARYRERLETVSQMKNQLEDSETTKRNNEAYIASLEEKTRQVSSLRTQADSHKERATKAAMELADEKVVTPI